MSDNLTNGEKNWREKLENHAADVPNDLFDNINTARLSHDWKKKLNETNSKVPQDMFERINAARLSSEWKKQLKDKESKVRAGVFEHIETVLDKTHLQKKLENYTSEVPKDLFERVMAARQPAKVRPILSLLGLGLVLLLFIGLVFTTTVLKKSYLRRYNNTNENKEQPTKKQNAEQGFVKKDIVVVPSNSTPSSVKEKVLEIRNETSTAHLKEKISGKQSILSKNNLDKNLLEGKISKEVSVLNQNLNNKNSKKLSEETFQENKNDLNEKNKLSNDFIENNTTEIITENKIEKKLQETLLENKNNFINKNGFTASENNNSEKLKNFAVNVLPLKTSLLTAKNTFVSPCNGPGDGCPTFDSHSRYNPNKGFFIDAFAGTEYVSRQLTAKSLDNADYRNARDTTERSQYAFTTGIGVGYEFKSGIVMRTGILYSVINEKAQFDSLGVGRVDFTILTDPTTGKKDTSEQIITNGIFRKARFNHYYDINIPVQIGYDVILKNNWSLMLKAGGGINIAASRKADILGTDFKLLNQTGNTSTDVFKNNIGGYVGGSIALYKTVDEHLLIGVEPSVRYYLSSFTQNSYPLSQSYLNFGVNATAKWKF